jgi:hypothetical protein
MSQPAIGHHLTDVLYAIAGPATNLGEAHRTMNVARKNGRPDSRRQEKVVRTQGLLSDEDGN